MEYYLYNPLSRNKQATKHIDFDKITNIVDSTNSQEINNFKANLKKNDTISIIGGDGTLHYIINNYQFLLRNKIIYHANGSGNDFNKSLHSHDYSYFYQINKQNYFINSFGIGFDALVCLYVNRLKNKSKISYIKQAYLSLKDYQPIDLEISYQNKKRVIKNVWLCSLQNGKYFGGGIKIAKNAKITEKEVELCIAHNLNRFQVLMLLVFVQLGLVHLFNKYFYTIKVNDFKIHNPQKKKIIAQLDGDIIEYDNDITLTKFDVLNISKAKVKIK